jgi:long-chain acyl-CoA synthetase
MTKQNTQADPSNIPDLLNQRVQQSPEKDFLFSEVDGRRFTYTQFQAAVDRAAKLLASNGISKGDVVSLLMPNSVEYIISYFACWQLGALAGPINSLLKSQEMSFVMSNSEAKALMVNSQFLPTVESIRSELPALENVIVFDDEAIATAEFTGGQTSFTQTLTKDDEAIIIYTSGTTGKPKGCLLTHGNVIANARQISSWLGFDQNDRLLTMMPLFHMNAVSVTTMSALYAGGSTVVSQKFSASRFWQIISDFQITSFGSVATMLSMLLTTYPEGVPEGLRTEQLRFAM